MVFNYLHPIIQVLPAIIGFLTTGVLILKFVYSVKIPEYNENPPGIIISSFIFIVSGFIFQIIYSDWSSIQSWAKDNASISFIFPILGTILGTFSVNRFLKKLADDKEKREIAVLFRYSIDTQVKSLKQINIYLSLVEPKEYVNYIQLYKNNLINSLFYDALNKIGIYNEKDIDILYKYSIELQQCFNYLERFLTELNEDIKVDITNFNQTKCQHQYERTLKIVKIAIVTTSLLGIFTSYYLSKIYLEKNLEELQKQFYNDYQEILNILKKDLGSEEYYIMNRIISIDLFEKLKYIREHPIITNTYNNFNVQEGKSIYLSI